MKNISILGSTGSIGVSALEVVRRNPSRFRVLGLAAGRNVELLSRQVEEFRPMYVSLFDKETAAEFKKLAGAPSTAVLWGEEGYRTIATIEGVETVLSAMVGAAGLLPTVCAIEAGKDVALANKETLVMAGALVMEKASRKGVRILPVDSEHSAIFQCLEGERREYVKKIILTASGGPFRTLPPEKMAEVSVEDALKHPNWKMGKKITIDSATMMNKGLEIIEAQWLFGVDVDRVHVVVHPQSIVHSMVEFCDGSVIAQLGVPDMKGPIAYALSHPERLEREEGFLDLYAVGSLDFAAPDMGRFPCLRLAYEAGRKDGTMPAIMNAANEVAVEAFLGGKIGFTDIAAVIEKTMQGLESREAGSVEDILDADRRARKFAAAYVEGAARTI
ncbi:MAG: 1-deoxy-D-xylulose-5-phosphate reductoisomerase [Syntrophobacterales bacterium]|nr:1-deoxy-D-xylulose-5-phosphate reductoisomerase [Syntrophobacterales bacterium]